MIKIKIWKPKKCNCVFWALGMQFLTGWQGRILILKSNHWQGFWSTYNLVKINNWPGFQVNRNSTGFHALWVSPDGQILSYSPNNEDEIDKKQGKRTIMFEGYIKKHPRSDIEKDDDD